MSTLPANYIDCDQGSADWFKARLGCVTSSRVADAIAKRKKGEDEMACRRRLRFELVCERLTGRASEHYVSQWMEDGKDNEPLARAAYEIELGLEVEQIGFVYHPSIKWAGASPDGLVKTEGLVEFKCPKTTTHLEYLLAATVPPEYRPQMFWQMACTERKWCDFVSYDPRLPKDLRLFVVRMERNETKIAGMNTSVESLLSDVEKMLLEIKERNKIFLTDGLLENLEKSVELAPATEE